MRESDLNNGGAAELYPPKINDYCRELCKKSLAVRKLYFPDERECGGFRLPPDGLGENPQSPVPGLIRRYPDRAVVITTGNCFSRCRFCFRKRFWKSGAVNPLLTEEMLRNIVSFLEEHREISDILLSGGDPMTLSDETVLHFAKTIRSAGNIQTVRICSRAPAVEPSRITDRIAEAFARIEGLWFVTHFDHPDELTPEAKAACVRLVSHGVPVLNQTVLLAGVNDDPEILFRLFKGLAALRVKPHYLFHVDPVEGVSHFATGVRRGLAIMEALRGTLSSLAMPFFAIDLPDGEGKILLTPDCRNADGSYDAPLTHHAVRHPLAERNPDGL